MRLLNIKTLKLEEFVDDNTPPYSILSHTWGNGSEELTFSDIEEGEIDKPGVGLVKFRGCCQQTTKNGLKYTWIDTCCIDKTNMVELSEAINSMFRWYKRACYCYVYLSDVPGGDEPRKQESKFRASRWFRRGWTLQELLAPRHVHFYNSEWCYVGKKADLHGVIGKITGIPRPFLLGITDLDTASVAQRMSWAAHRETLKKEDIAYCLLGIFGVTMPMIYGEGGDQAFFRLQEQIMKATRDDSILAWGLNDNESSNKDSTHVTPGRILASAPSEFANSKHIVSREQFIAPPNPPDLFGRTLRIYLSLLTTPAGKTIGLLNCGPEHDAQQVVGIPLAKRTSKSSDEHVRPSGYHSVLWPIATSIAPLKLVHIINYGDSNISTDVKRQYWLYDDDNFADINLELVDVAPRSCWDRERVLFMSIIKSSDGPTHRTLARFRHEKEESPDFVVVLESKLQGSGIDSQCCVMICGRDTPLEEIAAKLEYIMEKVLGKRSASNGLLNLNLILEPFARQPIFAIRAEAMPCPSGVTIDATTELRKSDIMLEFVRILEEGKNDAGEVSRTANEERNRLERIEKVLNELRLLDCSEIAEDLEQMDGQARLIWAAEAGYVEVVKLLLDKYADDAVTSNDGWTPLLAASSKGHVDVVRILISTRGVNVEIKDTESGRTPLSWAAANGHEAVVQLLLDTAKVDTDLRDWNGWTPLRWAIEKGHEAIVQQLLERGANVHAEDNDTRTALSYAAEKGHETIVQKLFEKGADVNAKDKDGRTAYSYAAEKEHRTVIQQLLKMGANVDCLRTLQGHSRSLTSVAFSHDSKLVVSGSEDHTIRLWDALTGECEQTVPGHSDYVRSVALSHNSKLLGSVSDNRMVVRLWDISTGQCREMLHGHTNYVRSVDFSHDSTLLASASDDHTIKVWNTMTGQLLQTLQGHSDYINSVVFSRDSKIMASASDDCTIRLWDVAAGQCCRTLHGHSRWVESVAFSHDSKLLVSGSADLTVKLWDVTTGQCWHTLCGHTSRAFSVAFSHDSNLVASGSYDGTVRLWGAMSGQCRQTLHGHTGYVRSVAFSHDGKLVASASQDCTIKIWDITPLS